MQHKHDNNSTAPRLTRQKDGWVKLSTGHPTEWLRSSVVVTARP